MCVRIVIQEMKKNWNHIWHTWFSNFVFFFFLEFTQVHGIGNVCWLALFINSRYPQIVWVCLFFIIILWYWLPFSGVHLWMVCIPIEKVSLTGNSDLTLSPSLQWGVTSSQLPIEGFLLFLLEEISFKGLITWKISVLDWNFDDVSRLKLHSMMSQKSTVLFSYYMIKFSAQGWVYPRAGIVSLVFEGRVETSAQGWK